MRTILLVGEKQSGKSSTAELIFNRLSGLNIKDGCVNLKVLTKTESGLQALNKDVPLYTNNFMEQFALQDYYKKCKIFYFADPLKQMVHNLFGIPLHKLYGTEADKNEPTDISWEDFSVAANDIRIHKENKSNKRKNNLTIRELLQYFADLCKRFDKGCFVKSAIYKIKEMKSDVSIIADCRFINEFELCKELDPIKIRLISPNEDPHASEQEMKGLSLDKFDLVLEKAKLTLEQKNKIINNFLTERGVW